MSNIAADPTMPPSPRELTIIVAATSKMGIGRNGTLPWTGLRKEMAYFARVTKRAAPGTQNTVIMGRKTWESIPPKFRPLKDRQNVVISRSYAAGDAELAGDHVKAGSLDSAIRYLSSPSHTASESENIESTDSSSQAKDKTGREGRAFVIGGGQIYKAALERKDAKRILLTRILGEFECDTVFPLMLAGDGEENEEGKYTKGWVRRGKKELDEWTGEVVPEGVQEEGGTRYVFEMWERSDKDA